MLNLSFYWIDIYFTYDIFCHLNHDMECMNFTFFFYMEFGRVNPWNFCPELEFKQTVWLIINEECFIITMNKLLACQ